MTKTKKLSALTIRRLRRVKDAILAAPEFYDQGEGGPDMCALHHDKPQPAHTCGSPQCILGWANFLFPVSPIEQRERIAREHLSGSVRDMHRDHGDRVVHAAARLRISVRQGEILWSVRHWPTKFQNRHDDAISERGRASNAARRIEHFIKTNGAE